MIPKRRADRGTPRALSAAISEALLTLKEDNPKLSVRLAIAQVKASGLVSEEQRRTPCVRAAS